MSKAQNLRWKGSVLFHGETMMMKIEQHPVYPKMYYVVWPDGVKSEDFYRIEYAKEHCLVEAGKTVPTEPADAFNGGARYQGSLT